MTDKKYQCDKCPESFWSKGLLVAHTEWQHVGTPGKFQENSEKIIEGALRGDFLKDEIDFADQIGSGDLEEAQELLKGGDV